MPIKKSAFKALRQAKKRTLRNLKILKAAKEIIKKARKAVEAKDKNAKELVLSAQKAIDKAWQKGVFKKNKAARLKSRLMRRLNK